MTSCPVLPPSISKHQVRRAISSGVTNSICSPRGDGAELLEAEDAVLAGVDEHALERLVPHAAPPPGRAVEKVAPRRGRGRGVASRADGLPPREIGP